MNFPIWKPSHTPRELARISAIVAVLMCGTCDLLAQVDAGAILGTVKDSSVRIIPGAKVTVVNDETGVVVTSTTNSTGEYTFAPIKIGIYSLTAEFTGFQRVAHTHVTVQVQQRVVVDFELSPGQMTETVTVARQPEALQTQDASVGQVVETRAINDLPLNGRNFTFLAQLAAGVTQDQQDTRGLGASGSFSANGERPAQNNYLLDGIDNNSNLVDFLNGSAYAVRPPVDAIEDFKIQTNNYSAEFGRSAGAILNATLKSGTNQFHGTAWEFLRNDALDAANFFENSGGLQKGEYRQNQFGAAVGGPIRKDKTFFFADYEGTRIRQAETFTETVPTQLERSSGFTNLSQLLNQGGTTTDALGVNYALGQVFDPSTTRPVPNGFVRNPFPGNILPASRLDPNAIKLLNLYPTPTNSQLFNNFASNPVNRQNVDQFDVRGDQNFSEKDSLFARVSYSDSPVFYPGPFPGIADGGSFSAGNQTSKAVNAVLSETHSFSPTLINEARVGLNRLAATRLQPNANTRGIPAEIGIQGVPQVPENGGLGAISISGLTRIGSNNYLPSDEKSRPVLPRMDLAAWRRRMMSRCHRRIVSGLTSSRSRWRRAFGIKPSRAASRARSAQFSFGRPGCRRCRTASWWRRIKISAVFQVSSRRDSRSQEAARGVRKKPNRRHMTGDHHGRTSEKATLLVRAADEILGTHSLTNTGNTSSESAYEFWHGTGTRMNNSTNLHLQVRQHATSFGA